MNAYDGSAARRALTDARHRHAVDRLRLILERFYERLDERMDDRLDVFPDDDLSDSAVPYMLTPKARAA